MNKHSHIHTYTHIIVHACIYHLQGSIEEKTLEKIPGKILEYRYAYFTEEKPPKKPVYIYIYTCVGVFFKCKCTHAIILSTCVFHTRGETHSRRLHIVREYTCMKYIDIFDEIYLYTIFRECTCMKYIYIFDEIYLYTIFRECTCMKYIYIFDEIYLYTIFRGCTCIKPGNCLDIQKIKFACLKVWFACLKTWFACLKIWFACLKTWFACLKIWFACLKIWLWRGNKIDLI
jgi:hypothetical protein